MHNLHSFTVGAFHTVQAKLTFRHAQPGFLLTGGGGGGGGALAAHFTSFDQPRYVINGIYHSLHVATLMCGSKFLPFTRYVTRGAQQSTYPLRNFDLTAIGLPPIIHTACTMS